MGAWIDQLHGDFDEQKLAAVLAEARVATAAAIFAAEGGDARPTDMLLAAALHFEMAADERSGSVPLDVPDQTTGNRLADALTAATGRRDPTIQSLSQVELAASLYTSVRSTAKAATVWMRYRHLVEPLADASDWEDPADEVRWATRGVLLNVAIHDFRRVRSLGARLRALAESSRLSRDHARFAHIIGTACEALDADARSYSARQGTQRVVAQFEVLSRLAQRTNDPELLELSLRLSSSVRTFMALSTSRALSPYLNAFSDSYLSQLTGRGSRRPVFELWPSQQEAISTGALRPGSWVVSLPTSAGKTLLAELRTALALRTDPDSLVVYVAPYVALANQVAESLKVRLQASGIAEPLVWTGSYEIDASITRLGNLLITTPEKLDAILRLSLEEDPRAIDLQSRLRLVILDECHTISTPGRGLTYELLITRIKERFPAVEFFAMSAVLGNPQAFAGWLAGSPDRISVSDWRPTSTRFFVYHKDGTVTGLEGEQVAGLPAWTVMKKAGAVASTKLIQAGEWPVLIMETQRSYAESAAEDLSVHLSELSPPVRQDAGASRERVALLAEAELGPDAALPNQIRRGVAFHHAGLPPRLRHDIERLVRDRHLYAVAATTTLAEGVDLPFRSIVCPHFNFDYGSMPRPLFLNLAGRAGRALVSTEGIVVFVEPGSVGARRSLGALLQGRSDPLEASSQLNALRRPPRKNHEWQAAWRFQSHLLGMVGDRTFGDGQAEGFIGATFAARTNGPTVVRALNARAQHELARMESMDPPLVRAASPFRLTAFGRGACLAGFSAESAAIVRRELLTLAASASAWLEAESWNGIRLAESARREMLKLAFCPLEAFAGARGVPADAQGLVRAIEAWKSGDSLVFDRWTAHDVMRMSAWLEGQDLRELDPFPAGAPAAGREPSLLELVDYFNTRASFCAWMYSGVVRIAEYLRDHEQVAIPEEIRLGIGFFRWGVDSRAALFLTEKMGLPRVAASRLAPRVAPGPSAGEDDVLFGLLSLSDTELAEILGDDVLFARVSQIRDEASGWVP